MLEPEGALLNRVEPMEELFSKQQLLKDYFFIMAGPCVVESEALVLEVAERIQKICSSLAIPFIFKASYRKANRSRIDSFTGIGDEKALKILEKVKTELGLPLVTDVHLPQEATMAAQVVDVLQIPAFLCRQTDLLVAAGETGKYVNIKKGQFLSAEAMRFAAKKVVDSGNNKVMLTERGTTFGYQDLVVDMRAFPIMKSFGFPVIMDATHSLQRPNQSQGVTGGRPELIETMALSALAAGADGLFIETHPRPHEALSDGANMLPLGQLESLLKKALRVYQAVNSN